MAKVFRIHEGGKSGLGWFLSELNKDLIETIDSEDHKGTKITTAVPTPFARMDLVRTAFKKVSASNQLVGDSDDHQLISNALDVGEILFNYEFHKDDLNIIPWKYIESENEEGIFNDPDHQHNNLGDTLRLFLKQDNAQYNFNLADSIYILIYDKKIIGATSPRTLFYSSVRSNEISIPISFGRPENIFGKSAYPLHVRSKDYITYLFGLSKKVDFPRLFPEFHEYLYRTLNIIKRENREFAKVLEEITEEYIDGLKELTIPNHENVSVEPIGGLSLRIKSLDEINELIESDFRLKPADNKVTSDELLPLVMPQGSFKKDWSYFDSPWNSTIEVPEKDDRPITERTLPSIGLPYPFVIASDFFTSKIIRLPHPIDNSKYVTIKPDNKLNPNGDRKSDEYLHHYLIPLTPLFFSYYTIADLEDRLKIKELAGGAVKVSLRLSTEKGDMIYTRLYSTTTEQNDYTIEEISLALGLLPFIKPKSMEEDIEYTIATGLPQFDKQRSIEVTVYNSASGFSQRVEGFERSNNEDSNFTKLFSFKGNFDFLEVKAKEAINVLIPKFYSTQGNKAFSFGIDFGTTNTHLAYRVESNDENFTVHENNPIIAFIKPPSVTVESRFALIQLNQVIDTLIQETLPRSINQNKEYPFPFQTCLLENQDTPVNDNSQLFSDANIGFDYGVRQIKMHLSPITNLKWAEVGMNEKGRITRSQIKLYIRELLLLCKWTVLKHGGDLSNTKVYWTYPTSMQSSRIHQFNRIWTSEFETIFPNANSENQLIQVPESTAPFHYAAERGGMNSNNDPTITIDVGGGTTDVAIFDKGIPSLITSFKFGGNSIFGDGYNRRKEINGFVQVFEPLILSAIEKQNPERISAEVRTIIHKLGSDSAQIMNYIFSLEKRDNIKGANITDELMEHDPFKLTFLIFYGAIIYHIAQIFKANDLTLPRNILFSGTASKSLSIIDASSDYSFINKYFRAIFTHVLGTERVNENIKMEVFSKIKEHKELTAKGMLYDKQPLSTTEINEIKGIHSGELSHSRKRISQEDLELDHQIIEGVERNCRAFLEMFKSLKTELKMDDEVGLINSSMELLDKISIDIRSHINSGIKEEYKDKSSKDNEISETLFFYAFRGLIPELAYEIANQKSTS